jgi:hypothetical protein
LSPGIVPSAAKAGFISQRHVRAKARTLQHGKSFPAASTARVKFPLDLLFLFPYSDAYACSVFPQVLRGLLQEMRPRRDSRNRRLPCQFDIRGVFPVWREAEISTLGGDPWQAAFRLPKKAGQPPARAADYCGKGASLMVLPSRADCLAASRICITTMFVSSDVRSPLGFRVPLSTAAR